MLTMIVNRVLGYDNGFLTNISVQALPGGITPMVSLDGGWSTNIVNLLISAGFASLVVQLLLVRQNRRKIEGEASGAEATAASVLSGEALKWVEKANQGEASARTEARTARADAERYFSEWNKSRWRESWLQARIQVLESVLTQSGLPVPVSPEMVVPSYLNAPMPLPQFDTQQPPAQTPPS